MGFRFIKQTKTNPAIRSYLFQLLLIILISIHDIMFEWNSILTCDCGAISKQLSRCDSLESLRSTQCFLTARLLSLKTGGRGGYVNEGWHSLLHDNSRGQTHAWLPRRLRRSSSSSSLKSVCMDFPFQVLQLLSHFNEFTANFWKQNHSKIKSGVQKCAGCVLIQILSISQKMTCRITIGLHAFI